MFTCLIFTTWPVHILYSLTIEKFCAFNFRRLSNWQKIDNRENFRPTVFIVHSYEYTTLLLKASGWSLPSPPPSLLLSPFPSLPPPSLLPLPYHPHNPLPISSPSHPLRLPSTSEPEVMLWNTRSIFSLWAISNQMIACMYAQKHKTVHLTIIPECLPMMFMVMLTFSV